MSETPEVNNNPEEEVQMPSELDSLKQRANLMGITYHPSIGVDALKQKIADHIGEKPEAIQKDESLVQRKQRLRKEASALVRIRITCMNPHKKDWEGEVFTVANSLVGTFRNYVPFETEWHVPSIILKMIKGKKYQKHFMTKVNGQSVKKVQQANEFAVEVLPPLTEEELEDLKKQQALNGSIE